MDGRRPVRLDDRQRVVVDAEAHGGERARVRDAQAVGLVWLERELSRRECGDITERMLGVR